MEILTCWDNSYVSIARVTSEGNRTDSSCHLLLWSQINNIWPSMKACWGHLPSHRAGCVAASSSGGLTNDMAPLSVNSHPIELRDPVLSITGIQFSSRSNQSYGTCSGMAELLGQLYTFVIIMSALLCLRSKRMSGESFCICPCASMWGRKLMKIDAENIHILK